MLVQAQGAQLLSELCPEDFTINFTRDVFAAMQRLGAEGLGDYALLQHELARAGTNYRLDELMLLERGVVALGSEMTKRITALRELRRLRALARLGERISDSAFEVGARSETLIAETMAQLEAIR